MKQATLSLAIILAICLAMVGLSSIYVLDVTKQAFITRFGQIVSLPIKKPGLKFKIPFLDKVNLFDKRYLEWDGHRNQVTTGDQRFIEIDTYARWQIEDARIFFEKVKDEAGATTRLDDILDGAARSAIADHPLAEIVRSQVRKGKVVNVEAEQPGDTGKGAGKGANVLQAFEVGRLQISREILNKAKTILEDEEHSFGIKLLDFRFKRINYAPVDQAKIFDRMIAAQEEKVAGFIGEGVGEALKIAGKQELEQATIKSNADREVRQIRGEAEQEAARIYTEAYNQSPESREFYDFQKTMKVYEKAISQKDWLIFSTKSEFFRYMNRSQP